MMKKMLTIILLLVLASQASSEERPDSDPNPYINLYLQRLIVADANIRIAVAKLRYENSVLEMYTKINQRSAGAVSLQEVLKQESLVQEANAKVDQAKAIFGKDDALWHLAKFRIAAGQDMPICVN